MLPPVHYGDLVADEETAKRKWGDILEFIGISRADLGLLASDWKRQIVNGHEATVANYNEVKQKLANYRGGEFLKYL